LKTINKALFRVIKFHLINNCSQLGLPEGCLVSLVTEVLIILSLLVSTLWRYTTKITIKKQGWHFSAKKILNKASHFLIIGANCKKLKISIIQDPPNSKISMNEDHLKIIMREPMWIRIQTRIKWVKRGRRHFRISK